MKALGLLAASFAFTSSAFAADVFVQQARGSDLSRRQVAEVTSLVKSAVRSMPEHQLVTRPNAADFVLQPTVLARGDEMVLRIEKIKNGEVLAMSEETINSYDASRARAMAVTETALQDDGYGDEMDEDDGTMSATSQSADDADSYDTTESSSDRYAADTSESQGAIEMNGSRSRSNLTDDQTVGRRPAATSATADNTSYTPSAGAGSPSVGELTAPSPRLMNPDRAGQIQVGLGPSFGIGMDNDNVMYDILIGYAVDFTDNFVGKAFGDLNFGTGSEASRFLNFGVAGEFYPSRELLTFGKPYLGADVGYAFARDTESNQASNLALGAAAGFKFQAAELNWDVNAHYTILLDDVAGDTPSVFAVRLALGF